MTNRNEYGTHNGSETVLHGWPLAYDTDLSNAQWRLVRRHIPRAKRGGRPRSTNMRRVFDALMYVLSHGCKWRGLPADFPPWQTVYGYFVALRKRGRWRRIHYALYEQAREAEGRDPLPSLLVIDSQGVKTGKNAEAATRGYDGGKRIKGRKRHVVTDSLGLLVDVRTTPANTHDVSGAEKTLVKLRQRWRKSRVRKVVADKGYQGVRFKRLVRSKFGASTEIGENHTSPARGFVPAKTRWVVERTLAWLADYRRLNVDRERLLKNSTSMVRLAFVRVMLRRLRPA